MVSLKKKGEINTLGIAFTESENEVLKKYAEV